MTELVDTIDVRITLRHDDVDSTVYSGKTDLRELLRKQWPYLGDVVLREPGTGKLELRGGQIVLEWRNFGLEEVPELAGGDN